MGSILRRVAAESGTPLVDFEGRLEARLLAAAEHSILGDEEIRGQIATIVAGADAPVLGQSPAECPAQALFRPDVVGQLGLERLELFEDHRTPPLVSRLATRFRDDDVEIEVFRKEGLPAEVNAILEELGIAV